MKSKITIKQENREVVVTYVSNFFRSIYSNIERHFNSEVIYKSILNNILRQCVIRGCNQVVVVVPIEEWLTFCLYIIISLKRTQTTRPSEAESHGYHKRWNKSINSKNFHRDCDCHVTRLPTHDFAILK